MNKIHVGITRKVGQPNYGSVGAECHLEIEIDSNPLRSPDENLPYRIQEAFNLCRQEVDRELSSVPAIDAPSQPVRVAPVNDSSTYNGNANDSRPVTQPQKGRPATDAQVRAIHAIASKANVRLASQLSDSFGVGSPQQLSIRQASDLIEKLKAQLPA